MKPTPLDNVRIAVLSEPCMKWIGLPLPGEDEEKRRQLAGLLGGNSLFAGS